MEQGHQQAERLVPKPMMATEGPTRKGFRMQGRKRKTKQNARGRKVCMDKDRLQLVPEELSLNGWKGRADALGWE